MTVYDVPAKKKMSEGESFPIHGSGLSAFSFIDRDVIHESVVRPRQSGSFALLLRYIVRVLGGVGV